jgi:D-alanyl-D-alanine carboxypeptidase/D-alanyl-D-alanine-endopeptidase (penicillin-binding protein 4)
MIILKKILPTQPRIFPRYDGLIPQPNSTKRDAVFFDSIPFFVHFNEITFFTPQGHSFQYPLEGHKFRLSRQIAQLSFIPQGHKFRLSRQIAQLSFIFLAVHLLLAPLHACGEETISSLIQQGSYLTARHNGRVISKLRPHQLYIPASIFKIVTSLASLETLGEDYRFPTFFYITPGIDLWIKGGGDPLLISEEIVKIAEDLKKKGFREFRHLYIDDTLYQLEEISISESASNNPYDTPLSALGVNFNTINIDIQQNGRILSGEEQTPTIPFMVELAKGLEPGLHRINVTLSRGQTQRLAAETFKAIFAQNGIKMRGTFAARKTPPNAGLFYIHYSKPVLELLPDMLLYSNNFMANQFFLAIGHKKFGPPVTWDKGRRAMTFFAQKKGVREGDFAIVDGAGLNRGNQITAAAMLTFLQDFRPYYQLLPLHNAWPLKTGTMTGVYSYAGYLGQDQNAPAVIIILNQEINNRELVLEKLAAELDQFK